MTPENLNYILVVTTLLGVVFGVWNKVQKPQITLDKQQALDREETEGKATLLAQQLQWTSEATDKRFVEMQKNVEKAFELAFNHSNEALTGVKELTVVVNAMGNSITRLSTIIEERLPPKI